MTSDLDSTHWVVTRNSGFFLSKILRTFTGNSDIIPEFSLDNFGIICRTIMMSDSNNSVLKSQAQFSLRPSFEFLAKFQNMSVTEVSNVRNIGELNNVNYYFVNCEVNNYVMSVNAILAVSYERGQQTDHVTSVNAILEVSYGQGQQTDHVPTVLEISITPMKPVTDFPEAGNGFFGVVCNKVKQEIFRNDCVNVSNMEDFKNVKILESSTLKNPFETSESSTFKNVCNLFETLQSSTFENVSTTHSATNVETSQSSTFKNSTMNVETSESSTFKNAQMQLVETSESSTTESPFETSQSSTFKNVSTTHSTMNVETSQSSTFKNAQMQLVETSQSSTFKNVSTTHSTMNVETSESSTFKNAQMQLVETSESSTFKNAPMQLVETMESSTCNNVSNFVETLESSTFNNVSNFVETSESSTYNVSNFVETSQSSTFNFISTLESAKNAQVQNIKTSKYFTFKNVTFQTIETSKSLMYISTVIVDKQHYLFHAATAAAVQFVYKIIECVKGFIHNEKMYTKKINCVKRFIHNRKVVHKKITCVKRFIHKKKVVHKIKCVKEFIHNKTFPVEISIWNCRCGAGIKHVQKISRLFFLKGYEFSDNVTLTAFDGGANLIFQNGFYIKISKAMVDANLIFQNGSHFKMSKSMVDGDANFIIQDGSDIRMSERGGGKTLLTLNMKCGRVCYNFETGATDCMVSKDKITKAMVDANLIFQNGSHFKMSTDCRVSKDKVEMSDGEGGDISHTEEVGGTSSTLNTSEDWGFVNSVTETTDCMVSEDVKSTLTLQNGSDIRFLAEGNLGILMELMRKSDQEFLEQVLALLFLLIAGMGVNKWIFSSPSFSLHQQILVSFRYRRRGGACVFRCDVILFHREVRVQMFYAPGEGLQGYCDRGMFWMKDVDDDNVESSVTEDEEEVTDEKGLVDDERQSDLSVSSREATDSHVAVHNVADEEMICDELHVIDKVEEDDVSQDEMIGDELLVIDEVEENDVSQEEMIGDELHVIDEVEEDDVSQEEMIDEKGLVGDERQSFLSVSSREATVNFAAIHKEPMAEEEMIGDVLHVIDVVEEDDVSQEEMFCEEEMGLVDDKLNVIDEESEVEEDDDSHEGVADEEVLVDGVLAVRTGMSPVSYAAVHKELPWCHHDDEDNVFDEEFEVEEEDDSQEEMSDEEDDVQHGVLAVRTGLSTVIHVVVNKVHDALAVMTRELMVIRAAVYKVCTADPQLSSALRAVQTGRCRAADGGRRERTLWQVIVL